MPNNRTFTPKDLIYHVYIDGQLKAGFGLFSDACTYGQVMSNIPKQTAVVVYNQIVVAEYYSGNTTTKFSHLISTSGYDGYNARANNIPLEHNPYPPVSVEYIRWQDQWGQADRGEAPHATI